MADETLQDRIQFSEKFRADLSKDFLRRKIHHQKAPFLVGFAGSVNYLKMVEPGMMRNKMLFGMKG